MNKHPSLKFRLNRELDNVMAFQFMELSAGGVDFGKRIVELYPELQKIKELNESDKRNEIANFTNKYYSKNEALLKNILKDIKEDWKSIANYYFRGVDKTFGNMAWPEGEYICYLSIFDCNPRFLEDKTFQVYFQHMNGTNYVIAHEMLHFIWFEYFEIYESRLKNKLDEHTIWLMSEWFNDLVLETKEFRELVGDSSQGYPEVIEFSKIFGVFGNNKLNIEGFFDFVKKNLDNEI